MNIKDVVKKNKDEITVISDTRVGGEYDEDRVILAKEMDKTRVKKQQQKINAGKSRKSRGKKLMQAAENRKIPKSVQETIPYKAVVDDYIILVENNRYSKTYGFEDINYSAGTREEQEEMLLAYVDVLNGFDTTVDVQITIHNNKINKKDFENRLMLKASDEGFKWAETEYNEMLRNKLMLGQNGISCRKYITVTVTAIDLESARQRFMTYEQHLQKCFHKLGTEITMLSANERIRILTDIFRGVNKEVTEISKSVFLRQAEKSLCCPDYFEFKRDYFMFDDKYARCVFFRQLPSSIKDEVFKEIVETNLNLIITTNIGFVEPDIAIKLVRRQILGMKSEKINKEKKAAQHGTFGNVMSDGFERSLAEAEELLDDLQSRNQKMMLANFIIMLTADSYQELENNTEKIDTICRKFVVTTARADFQQEDCLRSVLPLGNCNFQVRRTLTSESTAVFMPFNARELAQEGGMYYGLNQITNNIIIFNKKSLSNPNGFILGVPGSGKSFSAKREMVNSFLATDDEIIIIDPEREYTNLVRALNGEVVVISENSKSHFNPMEMKIITEEEIAILKARGEKPDDTDPVKEKFNFILSFFNTIMGHIKITPEQRTIIDTCLKDVYSGLVSGKTKRMPTLVDYFEVLKEYEANSGSEEARILRTSLELYVTGSMNTFSHKSNVDFDNRVVCFDIKDLGKNLKPLGMMVTLENLWAKLVKNRIKGKNTRIYIDEIYLLFGSEESSNFLFELYKRARKWGGIPTGITQNVEDLLRSETARSMLSNTEFILMLNQNASDRVQLADLLHISDEAMQYVTQASPGSGLLYAGKYGVIPFKDDFPTDTQLYKLMTTRFGEAMQARV